jgi:hypothetical protein
MKATILIFVLALTAVYGFYLQPNVAGQQVHQSNAELFKALSDYFYGLSTGSGSAQSLHVRG